MSEKSASRQGHRQHIKRTNSETQKEKLRLECLRRVQHARQQLLSQHRGLAASVSLRAHLQDIVKDVSNSLLVDPASDVAGRTIDPSCYCPNEQAVTGINTLQGPSNDPVARLQGQEYLALMQELERELNMDEVDMAEDLAWNEEASLLEAYGQSATQLCRH